MKESSASPESFGEEELTAYLLGELDVPTSQRLEQRLSEDPELRQLLKELSGSMELIREAFGNPVEQGAPCTSIPRDDPRCKIVSKNVPAHMSALACFRVRLCNGVGP